MASDFRFYNDAITRVDESLASYITDTASSVIGSISHVATTMLAIYICLWGWSVMRGMVSEPITDGVTRMIRLSLIYSIAITLGLYQSYVSDFLWQAPDAMANVVAGSAPGGSNAAFLDTLMSKIYDKGKVYWEKAGFTEGFGLYFVAIAIWGVGLVATAYGAFLLILSKMALAVLLGIGPMFIIMMIFEPTKRFFDVWLGQCLNFFCLAVLSAGVIKLILTVLEKYLSKAGTGEASIVEAFPAIALCAIAALVLAQLPPIASALGGGVAVGTMGAAGWAYGKAKMSATAMRPTNLQRTGRQLSRDGRIVGAAMNKVTLGASGRASAATSAATRRAASAASGAVKSSASSLYQKATSGRSNRVSRG